MPNDKTRNDKRKVYMRAIRKYKKSQKNIHQSHIDSSESEIEVLSQESENNFENEGLL